MSITKMKAALNFKLASKDALSLAGIVTDLPMNFSTDGISAVLNAGGASATFQLDAKGKGKSPEGSLTLKLKRKRNKATKQLEFAGGAAPFLATLKKGSWSDEWADEGVQSVDAANLPISMTIRLTLGGRVYGTTVNATYSAKAGKSGKFKK